MSEYRDKIEQALRQNEPERALAIAQKWTSDANASPKETAIEIARVAGTVYRDFVGQPVIQFAEAAGARLSGQTGVTIEKALGRLFRIAEDWENKVRACHEERLARELRDLVREERFEEAFSRAAGLCHSPVPHATGEYDKDIERRVIYVGNVLGTCLNHPKQADKLIQMIWRQSSRLGISQEVLQQMKIAKDERHGRMMASQIENIENQWVSQLNATRVEVMNGLPEKNKMGEPGEENLRDAGDIFRSILRVPIDAGDWSFMIDSTLILVDFVPKDLGKAAEMSGVEGRGYHQLGFQARKTVARTFMEIGKCDHFTMQYLQWAKGELDSSYHADEIIELMGALRSETFAPFLVKLWESRKYDRLRSQLSGAIGNLASPEAAQVMLSELKDIFTFKASGIGERLRRLNEFKVSDTSIHAGKIRRAGQLLQSLGRVMRSPRTDPAVRREIIDTVVSTVPSDHRKLGQMIATEVLAARPDAIGPEERKWAIDKLADSLWIQDQSTDMHRGGEREASIIGERASAASALKRLAKGNLEPLLAAFQKHSARYSGGYIAAAEILKDLGDPNAIPVLNQMLFGAATHDSQRQSAYQAETYWDPTDQVRKPLTKDKVVEALIFAIGSIGGTEAEECLKQFHKRVKMGQIEPPGDESMQLLARTIGPKVGAEASEPVSGNPPEMQVAKAQPAMQLPEADPAEVKKLVKALTASYFMTGSSKRAQAKIQALVRLGQLTPEDAIKPIARNLTDKDPMVASAAISTLSEYAAPDKPRYLLAILIEELQKCFESKSADERVAAIKVLKEIGPNRPEVRKPMREYAERTRQSDVRAAIQRLIAQDGEGGGKPSEPEMDDPEGQEGGQSDEKADPGNITKLQMKHAYMQARREWIAGGKQGPPPEPPTGI